MHGERLNASQGSIERFPRTTDISVGAVPEDPTVEKGASINVNSLTHPFIMYRISELFEFGAETSPRDVRALRPTLSDDRTFGRV